MIVEYIRYQVPQHEKFEAAYQRAVIPLGKAPQCLDYELSRCVDDPDHYILRIRWTSAEEHLRDFRNSEYFREFFTEIRPYVSNIQEMRHYQPVLTS